MLGATHRMESRRVSAPTEVLERERERERERENTVETREIVWSQVDEIRIVPESSRLRVEVRVELAAILTLASAK